MITTRKIALRSALVVGASGFIGSHLCHRLHALGAEVHGVSRSRKDQDDCGIRWWQADLLNIDLARDVIRMTRPQVVFHLGGEVTGLRDVGMVLPTYHNNLTTTVNLLTAATEVGCGRVVLAGSLEEPEASTTTALPCSPYAASKWAASGYARMFNALYGTPVVISRLFMVYGPGQRDARKLVPYVVNAILRGQAPQLSDGTRKVDWVYVEDVIDGLIAAAGAPGIEGETVDLGSGTLVCVRDLVEQLMEIIGGDVQPAFGALQNRPMEQVRRADIDGSFARLGWRPVTSLRDGLRYTVRWYEQQIARGSG